MSNLRKTLEEYERLYGEPIEAMVVGPFDGYPYDREPKEGENTILSREDGLAKVDYEYDNGYGGADCNPLYAWTASRVFMVHEYDGATGLVWVPRAPAALSPDFGGQSGWADFLTEKSSEAVAR